MISSASSSSNVSSSACQVSTYPVQPNFLALDIDIKISYFRPSTNPKNSQVVMTSDGRISQRMLRGRLLAQSCLMSQLRQTRVKSKCKRRWFNDCATCCPKLLLKWHLASEVSKTNSRQVVVGMPSGHLPQTFVNEVMICQNLDPSVLFCIKKGDESEMAVEMAQKRSKYSNSAMTRAASLVTDLPDGFLGDRTAPDFPPSVFELVYRLERSSNLGSVDLI